MKDPKEVRKRVSRDYGNLITSAGGSCCGTGGLDPALADLAGYPAEEIASVPGATAVTSFGCGNPVAFSEVSAGEVVLDLGSGAGLDLILAARKVGASGRVIGVDMTDEMIARARQNVEAAGLANVDIRKGIIEELPVESASVDWVISNCVINLSPEKNRVFTEIARVLKPGGRVRVSDIVVEDLPGWARENEAFYSGCVAGAIDEEEYRTGLEAAGLEEVEVRERLVYDCEQLKSFMQLELTGSAEADPCSCGGFLTAKLLGRAAEVLEGKIWSALFSARKPL